MGEALTQIQTLDQSDLDVRILKGRILGQSGDFAQSLQLSDETILESQALKKPFRVFKSVIVKSNALWRLGKVDEAVDLLSNNLMEKTIFNDNVSAEEHQSWLGQYYLMLGNVYHDQGDLNSSLIAFERCLDIREKLGNERDLSVVLNNIGNIYTQKGELTRAFETYLRSFEICVRINNERESAFVLGNLGIVSEMQGNYSLAIDFLERARTIFEKIDYKFGLVHCLDYIGKLNYQIGKNADSMQILESSLDAQKSLKNDILKSYTLYYLILVSVDNHELETAKKYFNILREISIEQNNKRVTLFTEMCDAIILKYSNRMIDKAEAQKKFKNIISQGYIEYEITIFATLHLCDLLMVELKQFPDNEILTELNQLVTNLFEVANANKLNSLMAETYVIKSKLALFLGDMNDARIFLDKALAIADENGYLRIAIEISNNFDKFMESSGKLEDLISKQSSLRDRLDIAEVEDLFLNIVRNRTTEINLATETAVGFYVINHENNPVYSKEFITNTLADHVVEWVSGLKRAKKHDSNEELLLDRLKYRQFTAMIKFESDIAFCYVFEGQSYSAKQKLESMINTLKLDLDIWSAFKDPNNSLSRDSASSIDLLVQELFTKDESGDETTTEMHQPRNLPGNMVAFKDYLHPVRLWILKILSSSYRISRSELSQILSVNSGTLTRHLEVFTSNDIIRQEREFLDDKPRIVYYLEPKGNQLYNEIKQSLLEAFV